MPLTRLSNEVPAVQAYSGLLTLDSLAVASDPDLPVAQPINSGDTTEAPAKLNRNAGQLDLTARYGGGVYAIAHGLVLSDEGGLVVGVSAGHALIDGVAELADDDTAVLFASTVNHVWFKRDGTIEVRNNVLTAPSIPGVYLGAVTTDGSGVTLIDESGRCELVGGTMRRRTADLGLPLDAPPIGVTMVAETLGGRWLWNGENWMHLTNALPQNQKEISASQDVVIPAGFENVVRGSLTMSGSVTVRGELRVED